MFYRVELCLLVTMATNMSTDKNVLMCKKCGLEHECPVGSKCERGKAIKDEKRDTSKETTVRKTPRGKGTDMSSHKKILETVMSTMTTFTDKLNSMEERLSGLTSCLDTPVTANKSASMNLVHAKKLKGLKSRRMMRRHLLLRDWPQFLRRDYIFSDFS